MSTQQDINAFRAQRLANTHDPLALMANTQTPFHLDQSSLITNLKHPQPNNNFVQQPSFNTNYMPQPMQNLKDSSDPTTAMNKALALIAKAFKINTIPTNNNQRRSLIPRNNQITQPDMNTSQDIKMQMVDDNVGNQVRQNAVQNDRNEVGQNVYGNGNVVTTPAEGNGNGINGNPIRCYNCRGEGHYASNCTVKPRKWDAAYLQQQLQIAQEEEAGIQSTQEEFEFMAAADAYEETERVKVNCTSEDTLQQASTSGTQSDNAPIYDSNGSTEVPKDENCHDHDIFNMLTHEVQYTDLQIELDRTKEKLENCIIKKEKEYAVLWNNWYTKCEECKYDKISYDKAYNDMQQKIEQLQAQLGDVKGKSSDTQCTSNTLDPVSQKLKDENVSLEFQVQNYAKENEHLKAIYKNLFDSIKVSKPKGTTKGMRTNTMFTKQSILGLPPFFSSSGSKLYSVTPFLKSSVLPKVDKTNALSKPVTSNSAPSTRESKGVQTVNVIAPRIFRMNPFKTSMQQANSDSNSLSSTKVNNTAKTRRPHPRSNSNTDRVSSKSKSSCLSNNVEKLEEKHRNSKIPKNHNHMSSEFTANHDVCVLNYLDNMNSRADNQSANVSIRENQKKRKANAKKLKELGTRWHVTNHDEPWLTIGMSQPQRNPSNPCLLFHNKALHLLNTNLYRIARKRAMASCRCCCSCAFCKGREGRPCVSILSLLVANHAGRKHAK
ncbi:integrase, catalytic region, zinc finger, CCHC-type containing protein [Tanacetum coccineum]